MVLEQTVSSERALGWSRTEGYPYAARIELLLSLQCSSRHCGARRFCSTAEY